MTFGAMLKGAMEDLGLSQAEVARLSGKSRASISQYVSGRQDPPRAARREIAEAMGLDPSYFDDPADPGPAMSGGEGRVRRLSVDGAAAIMGMSRETVRKGLRQGAFPWGYAVQTSERRWAYYINADRFAEIEGVTL